MRAGVCTWANLGKASLSLEDLVAAALYAGHDASLERGVHPATGAACWYLHPCETASALDELMRASQQPLIPAFLALVSTAVAMRA